VSTLRRAMNRQLTLVSLVVRDYDEAIAFFTKPLGFDLIEDPFLPDEGKR
jgi:catechol 2,3-dioxygenase-like lactoylglutathione lyase family enzyme